MTEKAEELVNGQRIGVIIMATAMVEASWKMLCETLGARFWPVAVHVSPDGAKRAYVGFCNDFDEVVLAEGEMPPRYLVDISTLPTGGRDVFAARSHRRPGYERRTQDRKRGQPWHLTPNPQRGLRAGAKTATT